MKRQGTKQEEGPKVGWGYWREKRDRALLKPRRNKGAQKLANAERPEVQIHSAMNF